MSDINDASHARRATPRQPLKAKPRPDANIAEISKEITARYPKTLAYLAD